MAESAKLIDNLIQLLDEHSNLIAVAKKDISHLLECLHGFQESTQKLPSKKNQLKQLRKDIRMIVHRAEDAIDKFLVKAMLRQEKNAAAKLFYFANRIASRRNFIEEIRDIIVRMEEIKQNNQEDLSPSLVDLVPSNEEELQDPFLEDDEVCGFEEKAQQLIKQLLEGSNDTGYVSIVGMPGLGKTTLAKIIYNNVQISEKFDCKIWVYVGKSDKMKDVCLNILKWFSESIKEYQDKNKDELAKVIFDFLTERKRCLIVLDDVWHPTVVSFVEPFSKNKKGDRIMITTRSQTVAQYANRNPYNMKFLTSEESIRLLERRTFGFRSCPDELVGHVKSIAEKCNGVPLAITVIARALRGRRNKKDWKRVEKNVLQHLLNKNDPKSCLKFVEMNYDYLPEEKKACFLYCATFPRGSDIPAWKLILLWIAEGLIKSQADFSLEETAAFYLNDLALRNLVLVKKRSADGQIKTCRVHDMLHEFCKMEAASESLFQEVCLTPDQSIPTIQDSSNSRRLCIRSSFLYDFISTKPFSQQVRSFLCFSPEQNRIHLSTPDIQLLHRAFPLIRVLNIESLEFHFTQDFSKLIHLRYIAVSGDFDTLPESLGKFWNLQTIILNTSTLEPTLDIKADIWNMLRLRHLYTNIPAKLPPPPTQTDKHSCLQILYKISPESCKKDVFAKAHDIRKLSIHGQLTEILQSNSDEFSIFHELKYLKVLKLLNNCISNSIEGRLHLAPYLFKSSHWLKKLTLSNTRFDWSDADTLGNLQCLEVLKLKDNAFMGMLWKPKRGGFSHLQVLWIEKADFINWKASDRHFPMLRHLVLISCDTLRAVPYAFANISNLQEMWLKNTINAINSAEKIERKKQETQAPDETAFKLIVLPENDPNAAQLG
ncbi:putative late blight resistance protein homolog R1A-10 [Lycium ferocissimum]|uniref:putative late blight resistance protein homolog R1A-10 n=1 Tax=Lycium ferocissimum TaxID=112874 RepID=UPI0028159C6C|nr:putative late blight resistance protein homolog R1A-10 [Lycium ferocissimum]